METKKKLTAKQTEIVRYFAEDLDVPDIIGQTGLAYKTIEKRVERIKDTLGVRTAQGIVAKAHRLRHINLDQP